MGRQGPAHGVSRGIAVRVLAKPRTGDRKSGWFRFCRPAGAPAHGRPRTHGSRRGLCPCAPAGAHCDRAEKGTLLISLEHLHHAPSAGRNEERPPPRSHRPTVRRADPTIACSPRRMSMAPNAVNQIGVVWWAETAVSLMKKRSFEPILACAITSRGRKERLDDDGQGGPSPQVSSSRLARILESGGARWGLAALRREHPAALGSPDALVRQVCGAVLDGGGMVGAGRVDRTFPGRLGSVGAPVSPSATPGDLVPEFDQGHRPLGGPPPASILVQPPPESSAADRRALALVWLDGARRGRFADRCSADPFQRTGFGACGAGQDAAAVVGDLGHSSPYGPDLGLAARAGVQQRAEPFARHVTDPAGKYADGGRHGVWRIRPFAGVGRRARRLPDSVREQHHPAGRGYPSADRTAGTTALCLPLAARSPCVPRRWPCG